MRGLSFIARILLLSSISMRLSAAQDASQHGDEHPPVYMIAERGQYSPLVQNKTGGLGTIKFSLHGLLVGFSYTIRVFVQCGERVFVDANEHVNTTNTSSHRSTVTSLLPEHRPCRMNITVKDIDRNLPSGETLIATFYVTIPFDRGQRSLLPPDNMNSAPFQASYIPALGRNSELHGDNHPAVAIHVGRSALTYTSQDDMRMELGIAV